MKKSEKNILTAFLLNLIFSVIELVGGIVSGSVSILSDSIHDFCDSLSLGLSYILEKKSKKAANEEYTYGYARYSVIGSAFITIVLIFSSCIIIKESVERIINPMTIRTDYMLLLAIVGIIVNSVAAFVTHNGSSMNQKAVNLHMLEDVLGWIIVLVGALVIRFANFIIIDPILSITISIFMLMNAVKHLIKTMDVFMEKSPIVVSCVKQKLLSVDGVIDVHHIHVWSISGNDMIATMHVKTNRNSKEIKQNIRDALKELNITHTTIELEEKWEHCSDRECKHDTNIQCNCCAH